MPEVRLDLTHVPDLDLTTGTKITLPARRAPHFGEQTALRAALSAHAAALKPNSGLIKDILSLKSLSVKVIGSIKGATVPSGFDLTIALGEFVSLSVLPIKAGAGGGFYFWWPPNEIGIYGSYGIGIALGIGVGGGIQLTFLFGPAPTTLGGPSIIIAVDYSFPGSPIFAGGFLVMSATVAGVMNGFGFEVGGGVSVFPVEIDVYYSGTATKKII